MKIINCLAGVVGLYLAGAATAQSPITVTINTKLPGYAIPADFTGVSIFTGTQRPGHHGVSGNLFSAENKQLITLFRNSGIRNLRLGATGSARRRNVNLNPEEIDSLFAFAKAAHISVIYSLHGRGGAAAAQYVWTHDRSNFKCFAFDNEPDTRGRYDHWPKAARYEAYLAGWRKFAQSVIMAVPGAKFAGPDAAGRVWAKRFAKNEKKSGIVTLITQHFYVGGNPRKRHVAGARQAINEMLSRTWVRRSYPLLYRQVAKPVSRDGYPYRLTESDDYVHGVTGASNALASALWALDYMHWWAQHGAAGVNFQNTEWLKTDTFYPDASGNYHINPKAYAIRAFDLGSKGRVEPIFITNIKKLNVTAYAVGDARDQYVTIINKEHGADARTASVTIVPDGFSMGGAAVMFLTAPHGNVGATRGVTLGGASITNHTLWRGQWTALIPAQGQCGVTVPAASAAVVKILAK